jgi:hypothetical protein
MGPLKHRSASTHLFISYARAVSPRIADEEVQSATSVGHNRSFRLGDDTSIVRRVAEERKTEATGVAEQARRKIAELLEQTADTPSAASLVPLTRRAAAATVHR